jgi:branched-chain amino acid transport system permease protein
MDYVVNLLSQLCIYVIAVASLDLLIGYAGILSFAHASFIGVGAYTAALLLTKMHFGFFPTILGAVAVTTALALIIGILVLPLSGDYFILCTIGLSMVTSSVMANWIDVTNGPFGIYGIPILSIFGLKMATAAQFFGATAVITGIILFIKYLLVSAPFGIALQAIREDETVAAALGKNVTRLRVIAFMISAAGAGIAGVLMAYNLRFIDPTLFNIQLTIFLWAALLVGGCASWIGNIVGPLILFAFPEVLRFVGLEGTLVAQVHDMLYVGLLICITIFRPQGIAGNYQLR